MLRRTLLLIPLCTVAIYACDDHHDEEVTLPAGYDDVLIVGSATDEALAAFAGALEQGTPTADPAHGAVIDAPVPDAMLPKATPATFSWHFGATTMKFNHNSNEFKYFPSPALANKNNKSEWLYPLKELIGPMRNAQAHGTPFTGTASFLVFATPDNPALLRIITSETSFTPDNSAWTKLGGAGKAITLTINSAEFENNRIVQGGGPFAGGSVQFTIVP